MHFIGMAGLQMPGISSGTRKWPVAVVLGALFGAAGLTIAARGDDLLCFGGGALLLATAILSMHFTAMAGAAIVHDRTFRLLDTMSLSPASMGVAVAAVVGSMLATCLIGSFSERSTRRKLDAQNLRLDSALNNMNQGLCMFDSENRLVVWNQRYVDMYRIDPARIWLGCTLRDLLDARIAAGTFALNSARYEVELRDAIKDGKSFTLTTELPDGRVIAVVNQPSLEGGWVATHEDITERTLAERDLERTRAFLDTVIENVPSPIMVKAAPRLEYVYVNRAAEAYLGIDRSVMMGKTVYDLMPPESAAPIEADDRKVLDSGQAIYTDEHTVITPGNGTRITTETRLAVAPADGQPQYVIVVVNDLTERKRTEQRIAHMAHHDALTDLPNRVAFNECIAATIDLSAIESESFALLSFDIDRFKAINDVFGHQVGDSLLREAAQRLATACEGAFLARTGGDEFVVISPSGPQPAIGAALAARLQEALASEIDIEGRALKVGLTIGVALYPQDGADAATLVANANAALYRAKAEARGAVRFFDQAMDKQLRDQRALQQDLVSAVAREELTLHYQPQARIDGTVTGFEALARWQHPRHGMVPPATFIPLAEESGVILRARRMGVARRLPRGGELADAADRRHQPLAGAVPHHRPAQAGARGAAGDGPKPGAARARDYRGRADRRFHPRGGNPAAAEGARRAHCDGRLRHRLFLAQLPAVVPVRQDQDRQGLYRQRHRERAVRHHRARGDRARPRPRPAGDGGRRRDRGSAQLPGGRTLRRGAGLSDRPAQTNRGLRRAGRARAVRPQGQEQEEAAAHRDRGLAPIATSRGVVMAGLVPAISLRRAIVVRP